MRVVRIFYKAKPKKAAMFFSVHRLQFSFRGVTNSLKLNSHGPELLKIGAWETILFYWGKFGLFPGSNC